MIGGHTFKKNIDTINQHLGSTFDQTSAEDKLMEKLTLHNLGPKNKLI